MKIKKKFIFGGAILLVAGAMIGAVAHELNRRNKVKGYRLDNDTEEDTVQPMDMSGDSPFDKVAPVEEEFEVKPMSAEKDSPWDRVNPAAYIHKEMSDDEDRPVID